MPNRKQKTFVVRLDEQTYRRLVAMSNEENRPYSRQVKVMVDNAWGTKNLRTEND